MSIGLFDNVVVYSLWLKRRSWSSILFGGISGGMPVLVGYAAIAGTISLLAVFLASLVVAWIPIHIWSISIADKEDYELARVPTLPSVLGYRIASLCLAAAGVFLVLFGVGVFWLASVNPFFTAAGTFSGAVVATFAVKSGLDKSTRTAWNLFKLSSPYLAMVFVLLLAGVWVS